MCRYNYIKLCAYILGLRILSMFLGTSLFLSKGIIKCLHKIPKENESCGLRYVYFLNENLIFLTLKP